MRTLRRAIALVVLAACSAGAPEPAALDPRNESCAWCRMAMSEPRLAAQLVAPNEEPRFYDDIGCLRAALAAERELPEGALAFVADHATGEWVAADRAVYTHAPTIETPMSSHLLAHRDAAARSGDPAARGGEPLSAADVFGPLGLPPAQRGSR